MTPTTFKILIRQVFGKKISELINSLWSFSLKPVLLKFDHLKLQSFKEETIKQVVHKECVFNIYLNPENGFVDQYIYLNGVYEDHILDLILKYLPSDGIFMDIGANIGLHSLYMPLNLFQSCEINYCEVFRRMVLTTLRSLTTQLETKIRLLRYFIIWAIWGHRL